MPTSRHPYINLPSTAFWKTAVAELDPLTIDFAWTPKFPITRETSIITVGSCFAQHISKSLKENGFNWLDSEPAPKALPAGEHGANNYGVFSFRTGNIYTAALLKQWIVWAKGAEQSPEIFKDGERFFDPYRPSINENGYASPEEMRAARQFTLSNILSAIQQADVFIFTLGLTEAWLNKNGTVYPMCPGTVRGEFSNEDHFFHNYHHEEIVRDLEFVFDALQEINPNIKFLLTVSPVPLTATASGEHVLSATTYSKSALRSAAGYLCQRRADVDYFPSYEIITAAPFKGQFFDLNMRSVTVDGVAFVMRQFLTSIGAVENINNRPLAEKRQSISSDLKSQSSTDEICDDIILESWSNNTVGKDDKHPAFVLIGDSHMGLIAQVLNERNIKYVGGGTMNASDWQAGNFDLNHDFFFLPLNEDQRQNWKTTYQASFAKISASSEKPLIITNLGQQRNQAYFNGFIKGCVPILYGPSFDGVIKRDDLFAYLMVARQVHIGIICRMLATGCKVLVITDPPLESESDAVACEIIDTFLAEFYQSIGCLTFNAGQWIKQQGGLAEEFKSTDSIHCAQEYYRQLTSELFSRFSIKQE
jgi:hypothetical protein